MKIEKLNENQLRATLSREDLLRRHIQFSEFAYGTDAARSLFTEMLRFASYKLGFETDDSPLMVEATPISPDTIVILVTKIPYPEELDTRFARFTDVPTEEDYLEYIDGDFIPTEVLIDNLAKNATDILDVEKKAREESSVANPVSPTQAPQVPTGEAVGRASESAGVVSKDRFTRLFCMDTIDDVLLASEILGALYHGENSLYRSERGYELAVHIGDHTPQEFNRIVNTLSEFGELIDFPTGTESYLDEHTKIIVKNTALQTLAAV